MMKGILKGIVFGLTFFVSIVVISKIMNRGNQDMTAEMPEATFPVVFMGIDGMIYNELHGYGHSMQTAYMRDTITALDEGRTTEFIIETYGQHIAGISYEIRSVDGTRLIEDTVLEEYEEEGNRITGRITAKDLLTQNQEYELILVLSLEAGNNIRYYTRLIWTTDYHVAEKMDFARTFHEKTFDKETVRELARYMETNSEGDNSTLHYVDIHCSLNQVSWGNLPVYQVTEPIFDLIELAEQTASIKARFVVATGEGDEAKYFYVEEFFRLRYTPDQMYLLDYFRKMDSLLDADSSIYVNDKILVGVGDENLPLYESEDGNIVAFELGNRLYSYNVTTNKLAVVFGFYDKDNLEARNLFNQHNIRILSIDEGGNIWFVVYGYMNRGRYEGEVGIQLYQYDGTLNTVEEVLYIPYEKTYQILRAQMEQLLYLSRESFLYLMFQDSIYEVDLTQKICRKIIDVEQEKSICISDDNKMVAWQDGGSLYDAHSLVLMDLGRQTQLSIPVNEGEMIMPLGFMGEDLIYGVAREEDILTDNAGGTVFPMYAVYICNADGNILKSYRQEGIYIKSCEMQNNQITLDRLIKLENGSYAETTQDHIMNSYETTVGRNVIETVITESYGKYVQIKVRKTIDAQGIQVLTPKEVLYEGGRRLELPEGEMVDHYYVYDLEGVAGIFKNPASAVMLADERAGIVVNDAGGYVWIRGNRMIRNQIMAIGAASVTEEKSSLAVCLDSMLVYAGVVRNSEYLLSRGETVLEILEENMNGARILNLQGCSLDAMLYYINRDIPVLAILNDGSAFLLVGFNQYNLVYLDPEQGILARMGLQDAAEWFRENGNTFLTYIP